MSFYSWWKYLPEAPQEMSVQVPLARISSISMQKPIIAKGNEIPDWLKLILIHLLRIGKSSAPLSPKKSRLPKGRWKNRSSISEEEWKGPIRFVLVLNISEPHSGVIECSSSKKCCDFFKRFHLSIWVRERSRAGQKGRRRSRLCWAKNPMRGSIPGPPGSWPKPKADA